ncbi:ribonuclease H1 isoform X2 [Nematostella vectensis]|uniref:ribonuclease H1 isoform X2 n=1 Tax=Nematostella vectensis TaxID=45351 RepID=UPI00207771BB|nr:ribonuclease H1 isoform X2 [Nematostella vectensis]
MLRNVLRVIGDIAMGKKKGGFYAVRVGRQTGVFDTWEECKSYVSGYAGAKFKKFGSNKEALDFVNGGSSSSPFATSSLSSSHGSSGSSGYVQPCPTKRHHSETTSSFGHSGTKRFKSTQYLDTVPASVGCTTSSERDRPVVYTDGCCTRNGFSGAKAGVGVYWGPNHKRNISERLPGRQTNQRAEIVAATMALESAKEMGFTKVEIRTDSKYTINGMTSWIRSWKKNGWKTADNKDVKNLEDFQKLDKLCSEIDVHWGTTIAQYCPKWIETSQGCK